MSKKKLGGKNLENCAYRHIPTVEHMAGKIRVYCKCGIGIEERDENTARKSWNNLIAKQRKRRKEQFTPKEEPSREIIESVYQNVQNERILNSFHDGRLLR